MACLSVGSEYFINSQELENKVRKLLPSQGGAGAGFDLSASTQIIPIIDLTESAEGSNLRQDLQTAYSHDQITNFSVTNTTTTIGTTTGYFRIFGTATMQTGTSATQIATIILNDGATDKSVFVLRGSSTSAINVTSESFDFVVFVPAGHSIKAESSDTATIITGAYRQIATIDGTLVNP